MKQFSLRISEQREYLLKKSEIMKYFHFWKKKIVRKFFFNKPVLKKMHKSKQKQAAS